MAYAAKQANIWLPKIAIYSLLTRHLPGKKHTLFIRNHDIRQSIGVHVLNNNL